jgi:hypothetical protein
MTAGCAAVLHSKEAYSNLIGISYIVSLIANSYQAFESRASHPRDRSKPMPLLRSSGCFASMAVRLPAIGCVLERYYLTLIGNELLASLVPKPPDITTAFITAAAGGSLFYHTIISRSSIVKKYVIALAGLAIVCLCVFLAPVSGNEAAASKNDANVYPALTWTCTGTFSDPWDQYTPYPGAMTNQQVQTMLSNGWSVTTTTTDLNVAAKFRESDNSISIRCGVLPAGTEILNGPSGEMYAKKSTGSNQVSLEVFVG